MSKKTIKSNYSRLCPKCGEEITYSTKGHKVRAERWNRNCRSCVWGSEEVRKNISESLKGKNNPMYGKTPWNKGKTNVYSEESNRKRRLTTLKNIENRAGQISPNYNSIGCEIIRWFNMYYDFNFQHAENGGEVCIDGYYPDGVDEERKTIIEIDEKHHFDSNGKLSQKDIRRQNYLENLGYKIIRIKL